MGLRTIVLKLHNPSKEKQKVIDDALLNYNLAFSYLMDKGYSNINQLKDKFKDNSGKYNVLALSKWIDKDMRQKINKYDVQPFKDSLSLEFGTVMANSLKQRITKPLGGHSSCRPIYFCRYDTKRSYCLLYDKEKDKYYVKLYLLNGANGRVILNHTKRNERLVHVHKDNNILKSTGRKECFIIVPLSFGKWQEEFIREASKTPENFRTARLFKNKNENYLAISIETGYKEEIKTSTFLGVCRGLKNRINYTVVSYSGDILEEGPVKSSNFKIDSNGIRLNELHGTANFISEVAYMYKAQVIVQDLTSKGDKLNWTDNGSEHYCPEYKCRDYNYFTRLLDYKLEWKCLPKTVRVSTVGVFYTCPKCGLNSKKNRFDKELFICNCCGTTMDIDKLGSINLARKLVNYNSSKIKINVSQVKEGIIFSNKTLGLICFSLYNENQLERLKDELNKIIKSAKSLVETPERKLSPAKYGLINKLKSVEDFMNLIEFN